MSLNILVVGAGAVGGYFGARLAEAGRDVTFMVRARRTAQLRENGLQVVSPLGNLQLKPKLVAAEDLRGPYDVILLSVKAYALAGAIDDFAAAVGPRTMIFPVLNGMHHMDELLARFGEHAVIGGVCRVSTELDDDGRIVQFNPMQELLYGELDGKRTPRIEELHETLSGVGFDARVSEDITQAMWDKWVQLASLGAVTTLFRSPVGPIAEVADGPAMALRIIEECAAIAAACGHRPADDFLAQHGRALTKPGSPFASSMFRDWKKSQPVEVESILGDLLARGRSQGLDAPLLTAAAVGLRVYQASLNSA
jgi:2-dehydropantoate 2-reductase